MRVPVYDRYGTYTCMTTATTVAQTKQHICDMINIGSYGLPHIRIAAYWNQAPDDLVIDQTREDYFIRMRMREGCPVRSSGMTCPCAFLPSAYYPHFPWRQYGWPLPHSAREEIDLLADLATLHGTARQIGTAPARDEMQEKEIREMDKSTTILVRGYYNEPMTTVQQQEATFPVARIRRELMAHTQIPLTQIKLAVEYDDLGDHETLEELVSNGAQIRFRLTTLRNNRFHEGTYACTCWDEYGWSMPWTMQEEGELRMRFNREYYNARNLVVANLNKHELEDKRRLENIFFAEEDIPGRIMTPHEQLIARLEGTKYPPRKRHIYFWHSTTDATEEAAKELEQTARSVGGAIAELDPRREGRLVGFTLLNSPLKGGIHTGKIILESRFELHEMQEILSRASHGGVLSTMEIEWEELQCEHDNNKDDHAHDIDMEEESLIEMDDDSNESEEEPNETTAVAQ